MVRCKKNDNRKKTTLLFELKEKLRHFYVSHFFFAGPAMVVSVVSLLVNVLLIGGARQLSKDFLLVWIIWKCIAIVLVWLWYGYNVLKDYGYIDWTAYGMKGCLFCSYERYEPEIQSYVGE